MLWEGVRWPGNLLNNFWCCWWCPVRARVQGLLRVLSPRSSDFCKVLWTYRWMMDILGDTRAWPTSRRAIAREIVVVDMVLVVFVSWGNSSSKGGLLYGWIRSRLSRFLPSSFRLECAVLPSTNPSSKCQARAEASISPPSQSASKLRYLIQGSARRSLKYRRRSQT